MCTNLVQYTIHFAGYFCLVETITPEICPSGYYCPEGTEFAAQYPCPSGTYNNNTGMYILLLETNHVVSIQTH